MHLPSIHPLCCHLLRCMLVVTLRMQIKLYRPVSTRCVYVWVVDGWCMPCAYQASPGYTTQALNLRVPYSCCCEFGTYTGVHSIAGNVVAGEDYRQNIVFNPPYATTDVPSVTLSIKSIRGNHDAGVAVHVWVSNVTLTGFTLNVRTWGGEPA